MSHITVYSLAFSLTVLVIVLLKKLAHYVRLVDHPDERKLHHGEIPLIGGIAMYIAIVICSFFVRTPPHAYEVLLHCLFILVLFGALDDKLKLSARVRLLVQILTVVAMSNVAHLYISNLGNLLGFGIIRLPDTLAIAFTVFCVVGVLNAFNMIDGIDGLAGGIALVALLSFSWVSALLSLTRIVSALLLLSAILAGFLVFNMRHPWRKKAAIFMGDAGSTMLGFILAWFAVDISQISPSHHLHATIYPISTVWILALPIMDALTVMTGRMLAGRSPFSAGRDHLHHILLDKGFKESNVVLIILALSGITSLFGIIGWYCGIQESRLFYGLIGLFAIYFYLHRSYRHKAKSQQEAQLLWAGKEYL